MKAIFSKLLLISAVAALFGSCKKDDARDYLQGGTAPALSANASGTIPLSYVNADKEAITLKWTNPNYQFASGISSQNVTYLLEIDTTGANFTNPNRQSVSISQDLTTTFTQGQLNDWLLNQLRLDTAKPHNIEMRITSSITSATATNLYSNVLKFVVVPYAIPPKVQPPSSGQLFITGSATSGGWMVGGGVGVPVPNQQFTKIDGTTYQITVALIGGQEYLFVPVNGDWGHKYGVKDKTVAGLSDGGDFGFDFSANFPGPAVSGTYKIVADFQRGKFTVTKQ